MTDEIKVDEMVCPKCGSPLKVRNGKFGQFLGCSNYPECTYTDFNALKGKQTSSTAKATVTKTTASKPAVKLDPDTVVEEFKRTYDEVIAEFAGDYPETVNDPKALQALVATIFIEKNNRRKGR